NQVDVPGKWETLAGEGFSVELPGVANARPATLISELGYFDGTEYRLRTDKQSWVIGVYRLPEPPKQQEQETIFERAFRGGLGYIALVRHAPEPTPSGAIVVTRGGRRWPGRRFRYLGGTTAVLDAIYVVDDRLYSLGMVVPLDERDAAPAGADEKDF